jgi:protein-tyrosine-phosphatase
MTAILVVCTGNICRSPMAEGFLRDALIRRFGERAPAVSSAGTIGWTGSPASPESVVAAGERGSDIEAHQARELRPQMIEGADLILCMAGEHREAVGDEVLEALPPAQPTDDPGALVDRVAAANELRFAGGARNPHDEDISDPLGLPLDTYRAIAWELDEWNARLVDGLFGAEPSAAAAPTEEAG